MAEHGVSARIEQVLQKSRSETNCVDEKESATVTIAGSEQSIATVAEVVKAWLQKAGETIRSITAGSMGYDDLEPIMIIEKPGGPPILYTNVTEGVAHELVADCLAENGSRPDLAFCVWSSEDLGGIPAAAGLPLFNLQKRIALRNCGFVDPEDVADYLTRYAGYRGLAKALQTDPIDVIDELGRSGLKGEEKTGRLMADTWKTVHEAQGGEKYVICNAVDADGRARTSRLLMQGDPHSVLEGMLIAAYAVGASRCILAVAAGDEKLVQALMKTLVQMRNYGLLGKNILDSEFSCDIEIKGVEPALVVTEETALMRLLEGGQAMPYITPQQLTFRGAPSLVDNAETLATVPVIFEKGARLFIDSGPATKVVSLSGAVAHPYTVEVPLGTTLETIICGIGGGVPDEGIAKAVQFGGPTGVYLGADSLNTAVGHDALRAVGSMMGSGAIEVIAEGTCAVEMAEGVVSYIQRQSCGKCVFCREGTIQMSEIIGNIARAAGGATDLELLVELGEEMKVNSLCGVGRSAANPVLSSIQLFREEYDAHIKDKQCPVLQRRKRS